MLDLPKNAMIGGRRGFLLWGLLSVGSALLIMVFFWDFNELTPIAAYQLLGLVFIALAALAIWKWNLSRRYGRIDPFELPTWFTINVIVFMVISGAQAFIDPELLYARLYGDYWYLVLALLYVALGTLALWLGYRYASCIRIPKLGKNLRLSLMQRDFGIRGVAVLSIYAACVGTRLFQILTGQFAYLQDPGNVEYLSIRQWLNYSSQMWVVVLPAVALTVFKGRLPRIGSIILFLMVLVEVAFTFIGGIKGAIFYLIMILLGCKFYTGRPFKWFHGIVLGVLFILVFPINNLYRQLIVSGMVDTRSVIDTATTIITLAGETWLSRPISENLEVFLTSIIGRQSMLIQSISLAAITTPETIPFRYGHDYFLLPLYILIPRVIWPSKPILSGSIQFSIDYAGQSIDTTHSTAVTPFGDLYLNFGLPGIIGGMFLLGILYRLFYQAFRERNSESSLVLYLGLLFWMTNIEAEIVGLIQGAFQQLIIFYVLTRMMYQRATHPKIKYKNAGRIPSHVDGDECGAGAGGIKSPSTSF